MQARTRFFVIFLKKSQKQKEIALSNNFPLSTFYFLLSTSYLTLLPDLASYTYGLRFRSALGRYAEICV